MKSARRARARRLRERAAALQALSLTLIHQAEHVLPFIGAPRRSSWRTTRAAGATCHLATPAICRNADMCEAWRGEEEGRRHRIFFCRVSGGAYRPTEPHVNAHNATPSDTAPNEQIFEARPSGLQIWM